ncbi:hypothetical protein BDBG_00896 [Blastomyces gilchristii SLH14081]|uniref:Uncharacterized protein n=1 Tax=Blastomyces gilchristii (strain SLH14081) TaxID=559298 RepID=A0A179UAI0_BLAGS|nr:uncharacterized protein BDBG_00896 [Blastomyces gilchristii SLH14081]OAT04318.1 hypothetical protein BDBG_00896 [Blastomyces gilchristii SLH14081]
MADITFIIPSDPGAGAANSTFSALSSSPSAFTFFMTHLFPPHDEFDNDPASVYHQNDDDDNDDDDDDDNVAIDEDEAMNEMCTLTLSIKNHLQLIKAIVDQASENVHTVLIITASQMRAEIYRKVITCTAVIINLNKFHSEKNKQLEKNALESRPLQAFSGIQPMFQ